MHLVAKMLKTSTFFLAGVFCLAACGGGGGGGEGNTPDPPNEKITSIYNFSYKTDHGILTTSTATDTGNRFYFTANDGDHGLELWSTGGTADTTTLVLDASPGYEASDIEEMTPTNDGVLFFTSNYGTRNRLFYCSHDGKDRISLTPNAAGHHNAALGRSCLSFSGMYTFCFSADGNYLQPWITDLSVQNTRPIADVTLTGKTSPGNFTIFDDKLLFTAVPSNGTNASIYVSMDGTQEKTHPLDFSQTKLEDIDNLAVVNNVLVFTARSEAHGYELWCLRADGQGGFSAPTILGETNTGSGSSLDLEGNDFIGLLTTDGLIFEALDQNQKAGLWRTDGTELHKLIGTDAGLNDIKALYPWRDGQFFVQTWQADAKSSLWVTDGTQAGTLKLHTKSNSRYIIARAEDQTFFAGDDTNCGLYRYSYGADQAELVVDLADMGYGEPDDLAVYGNRLFFTTFKHFTVHKWISDGTRPGTRTLVNPDDAFLKSIYRAAEFPTGLHHQAGHTLALGKQIVAYHDDEKHGYELWLGDGTLAGSQMVKDINTHPFCPPFTTPVVWNDQLYFGMKGDSTGIQIWRSNGMKNGTAVETDLGQPLCDPLVDSLSPAGGDLYFTAKTHTHGNELWHLTTTSQKPERLTDLWPDENDGIQGWEMLHYSESLKQVFFCGQENGKTYGLYAFGSGGLQQIKKNTSLISEFSPLSSTDGIFYFLADSNFKLWRTTGENAQTRPIADTHVPNGNALVAFGKVFFIHKGDTNQSLRVYDPETDRVVVLKDGFHFYDSAQQLLAVNDAVVFLLAPYGKPGVHGVQLWQTKGTVETTSKIMEIPPEQTHFYCGRNAMVFKNRFCFLAHNEKEVQLWGADISTGSIGQPKLIKRIGPYLELSTYLTGIAQDHLFFVHYNAEFEPELWISDATAVGTKKVTTLYRSPYRDPLFVMNTITAYNGKVYFIAYDHDKGLELMALEP